MRISRHLVVATLAGCIGLHAEPDPLDAVEKRSAAWIELRSETVRLVTTWQTEQALMDATISALEERATAAEEERDLQRARSGTDREELATLAANAAAGASDQKGFEQRLVELDARLLRLRTFLPPRLSDALDVSFTSLSNAELSPGERIQLTMSVLNRCIQFSRTITAADEVLRLGSSNEGRMFEVIYWGVSHGYAVDRAAHKAWYGSPGPEGWHWTERDDLYAPATQLIAVFNDQRDPEFVSAPARLSRPVTGVNQP